MAATILRRVSGWLLAGAVVLSALTGCSSDRTYLPALQGDPVASWVPGGAELVSESEREYDEGGSASKQSLARLTRAFRLGSPGDVDVAQERALSFARTQAGWGEDELGRDGFLQRSGPSGSTMTLSVLPSATSDEELVITLSAP